MVSFLWYVIGQGCALGIAGLGMDFSPSFTALFVMIFLAFTALGEVFLCLKGRKYGRVFAFWGRLFPLFGAVWAIPAAYIYAFGIDGLDLCLNIGMIGGVVLHLALWLGLYRGRGWELGLLAGAEQYLLLAAGLFAVACAVPCPALWPYGLGILLILAARLLDDVKGSAALRRRLTLLGMFLCAVFPAAPMFF